MKIYEIDNDCEEKLMIIEEVISKKKNMLYQNQQKIKSSASENKFLEKIRDDYEKLFYIIAQQKKEQIKALQLLNDHINEITNDVSISYFNKIDAEKEKTKILNEIQEIQTELDSIIDNTKSLKNKINK